MPGAGGRGDDGHARLVSVRPAYPAGKANPAGYGAGALAGWWLEVVRVLVGEDPGHLGGVARVVGLLGGGNVVAAEVQPAQAAVGEDAGQSAALAATGRTS